MMASGKRNKAIIRGSRNMPEKSMQFLLEQKNVGEDAEED